MRSLTEVRSGLIGERPKLRRILSDLSASMVVVEHRDRLTRFGVEHLGARVARPGRRIIVAGQGETASDLLPAHMEVLTSMWAHVCMAAAMRAVTVTNRPR